jgi:hypothetical protein
MAKRAHASPPVEIDIQIERWPIERLIPRANNPRTHSREQIALIAASMREWGWTNPILVGADDDIIAGHARLLAAEKLGMKEVPVIVLRHLSPVQRRALVIADNQLAIAGAGSLLRNDSITWSVATAKCVAPSRIMPSLAFCTFMQQL